MSRWRGSQGSLAMLFLAVWYLCAAGVSEVVVLLLLKGERALLLLILSPSVLSDCLIYPFLLSAVLISSLTQKNSQLFSMGVCPVGLVHRGVL